MIDKKFEDKLKNLRELYIDKRPEVSQKLEDSKKFEAFMALSDEEKEEKLLLNLAQGFPRTCLYWYHHLCLFGIYQS